MIDCDSRAHILEIVSVPENLNLIAKEAFKMVDKNKKGCINIKEFELCMKNVSDFFGNKSPPTKNLENEFERLDIDKNGIIEFKEFKKYVKEIIEQMLFI